MFDTRPDTEFQLSAGGSCPSYLLEIEGLFTQGWRPGRTFGEVGRILVMNSSDWSNVIRHRTLDTRSNTEFKMGSPSFEKPFCVHPLPARRPCPPPPAPRSPLRRAPHSLPRRTQLPGAAPSHATSHRRYVQSPPWPFASCLLKYTDVSNCFYFFLFSCFCLSPLGRQPRW